MAYGFDSKVIAAKMLELENDAVAAFEFETEIPLETICKTLPVDEAFQVALQAERDMLIRELYEEIEPGPN